MSKGRQSEIALRVFPKEEITATVSTTMFCSPMRQKPQKIKNKNRFKNLAVSLSKLVVFWRTQGGKWLQLFHVLNG
jgi:hypothetical protein